jgi:hypothetical protein
MHLPGAAQNPAHEYKVVRKHPAGHRRARRIAMENGVHVDDSVKILREKESNLLAGTNAHASYLSRRFDPHDVVHYEDLFPDGRVFIWMHRSVYLSDESIVAHLAHELYEVKGLKQAFADAGGWMRARDFIQLIRAGKQGNLHDQAWDEANRVVDEMRARKNARD